MEVIGARPCRAKAKRREASGVGELACSSEALFPLGDVGRMGDGAAAKVVRLTPGDLSGSAHAVGQRTKERRDRWPDRSQIVA